MPNDRIEFGDRVRHRKRPEWGVGSVVRTEDTTVNGTRSQRVSIRFPAVGVKTLSTLHAELERLDGEEPSSDGAARNETFDAWHRISESEWLAPVAQRKVEEAMTSLPAEVLDPFQSLRQRLAFMFGLYRFDRSGRGLMDWAVAQTGLNDPLTRFSRHELEQFFDRWAASRDVQLARLIAEAGDEPVLVQELVQKAVPSARQALKRLGSVR